MDHLRHLHSNERILHRTRLSKGVLFLGMCRGLLEGLVLGAVLGGITALLLHVYVAVIVTIFCMLILAAFRWHVWHSTILTITTQRILFQGHGAAGHGVSSPFALHTETVRWDRYQEGVYSGGLFSSLWNIGTLTIRYGTADGGNHLDVPSLPWAADLKHYCDKIQSLRGSQVPEDQWPAFIPARRGRRG